MAHHLTLKSDDFDWPPRLPDYNTAEFLPLGRFKVYIKKPKTLNKVRAMKNSKNSSSGVAFTYFEFSKKKRRKICFVYFVVFEEEESICIEKIWNFRKKRRFATRHTTSFELRVAICGILSLRSDVIKSSGIATKWNFFMFFFFGK